ncbi:MAG TPA: CcmD family protein [Acidobacteriota bacterium]|nr:CcmD family protein [Acidobacteriota bacterium]
MSINWYLFGGYASVWTILFLLLLYILRKQRQLTEEIRRLQDEEE